MSKYRLYDIAKELNISNKELMDRLPSLNIEAKSHSSTITEGEYKLVTGSFQKGGSQEQPPKTPAAQSGAVKENRNQEHNHPEQSRNQGNAGQAEPRDNGQDGDNRQRLDADGNPIPRRKRRRKPKLDAGGNRIMPDGTVRPPRLGPDGQPLPRTPRPLGPDGQPIPRQPRLGPDGQPIPRQPRLGPDGQPIPRPPRPVGPDGQPIPRPPRPVGPDGQPIPRPPRPVGPDGQPIPRQPRLGPDGQPIPRPPRPVGPDGQPIPRQPRLGPDGQPIPRPPRPVGPDGQPIPRPPRPEGLDSQSTVRQSESDSVRPVADSSQQAARQESPNAQTTVRPTGSDGQPIPRPPRPVGPDGQPIPRPPRPVGPDGQPIPRPPRPVGPDGQPIPRPPRPVGPDGQPIPRPPRPVGPDGQPIPRPPRPVGPDGQPIPRPPRPVGPDGQPIPRPPRPVGPDGQPIPRPPRPAGSEGYRPRQDGQSRDGYRPRPEGSGQWQNRPPRDGQGGFNRPSGDRPGGFNRPGGDRPGGFNRPSGDRPGGFNRPSGDRPGGFNRPGGDRPGGFNRPSGDRPGGFNRPGGDRPGGFNKPGDRPGGFGKPGDRQGGGRFGGGRPSPGTAHDKATGKGAVQAPDKTERQRNLESQKNYKKDKVIIDREGAGKGKPGQKNAPKTAGKPMRQQQPKEDRFLETRTITIPSILTLKELAEYMGVSGAELVKTLIKKGQMIGINNEIPYTLAADIALNYNIIAEERVETDIFEDVFGEAPEDESMKASRPPVVVVMGHVDHGKTSLLDAIRDTSVTKAEHGGITQHIGAYMTQINEKPITFLDTPGHEAFTAMRMRGAQVTDIAVLVVAADDGVMPQTIEAISHAKAAGVDIIVAINKMDMPSANPDRVKQELTEYGLVAEEWGGETICVPVSAKQRTGIDELLEMIILVADMKDLKANADKRARGVIIEAKLDKGRGPVATVLVQEGTLNVGDPLVAGMTHGRVRAMLDDKGRRVKKATPAMPVEIQGMPDVPNAGDMFYVAESEKQARMVAETYYAKGRFEMTKAQAQKVSLDDLFNQIQAGKVKELNVIIKADVQGSVEAIRQSLDKLSNEEVRIKTILGNVGAITESDVSLASASNAIIIGFNVRPEQSAKVVAEEQKVDIRLYRVIYSAIEDIQAAMKGLLDPVFEEHVIGKAEVRQIFKASGIGTIAGSYVLDGKITRNASARIVRDGIVVYDGSFDSVKRFKDDVREVSAGYECGLVLERYNDIKTGDIVEAYVMEEIKR